MVQAETQEVTPGAEASFLNHWFDAERLDRVAAQRRALVGKLQGMGGERYQEAATRVQQSVEQLERQSAAIWYHALVDVLEDSKEGGWLHEPPDGVSNQQWEQYTVQHEQHVQQLLNRYDVATLENTYEQVIQEVRTRYHLMQANTPDKSKWRVEYIDNVQIRTYP